MGPCKSPSELALRSLRRESSVVVDENTTLVRTGGWRALTTRATWPSSGPRAARSFSAGHAVGRNGGSVSAWASHKLELPDLRTQRPSCQNRVVDLKASFPALCHRSCLCVHLGLDRRRPAQQLILFLNDEDLRRRLCGAAAPRSVQALLCALTFHRNKVVRFFSITGLLASCPVARLARQTPELEGSAPRARISPSSLLSHLRELRYSTARRAGAKAEPSSIASARRGGHLVGTQIAPSTILPRVLGWRHQRRCGAPMPDYRAPSARSDLVQVAVLRDEATAGTVVIDARPRHTAIVCLPARRRAFSR